MIWSPSSSPHPRVSGGYLSTHRALAPAWACRWCTRSAWLRTLAIYEIGFPTYHRCLLGCSCMGMMTRSLEYLTGIVVKVDSEAWHLRLDGRPSTAECSGSMVRVASGPVSGPPIVSHNIAIVVNRCGVKRATVTRRMRYWCCQCTQGVHIPWR